MKQIQDLADYCYQYDLSSDGKTLIEWSSAEGDVVIPEGVTTIGYKAFDDCSSLSSVVIPEGVTTIEDKAFDGCSSLNSVVIPEGVTTIGDGAFCGCHKLMQFIVSERNSNFYSQNGVLLSKDGKTLIAWSSAEGDVVIPGGVMTIGGDAFRDCTSLSSLVIPKGVTTIGDEAFSGCSSLSSVVIPEGVTTIGWKAFYGCSSLSSVVIPDSVKTICRNTFIDCPCKEKIMTSETKDSSAEGLGCIITLLMFLSGSCIGLISRVSFVSSVIIWFFFWFITMYYECHKEDKQDARGSFDKSDRTTNLPCPVLWLFFIPLVLLYGLCYSFLLSYLISIPVGMILLMCCLCIYAYIYP